MAIFFKIQDGARRRLVSPKW